MNEVRHLASMPDFCISNIAETSQMQKPGVEENAGLRTTDMLTPELDFVTVFNAIEAVWWFVASVLMWRFSRRHANHSPTARYTAMALFVFGLSDVIEVFTGAWWRPWWLAVMKIACGVVIVSGGWILWKQRKLWQKTVDAPASTG